MSVDIEPLELNFRRPFTVEVPQILKIKNPGSSPLAFKVKTTAPKQYCVRPNAGRIEPGQDFDVTVIHSAMKEDVAPGTKCRDKFLVQSVPITPDKEFSTIASVLDNTDKSLVQERKIRVNWLAPAVEHDLGSNAVEAAVTPNKKSLPNGTTDTPEPSHTFSSPSANADSAPPPYSSDTNVDDDDRSDRPKSAVSQAATTIPNTAQATYEELKAKLAQAEAQLANASGSGLRQRNVKGSAAGEKPLVGQTTQAIKQSADGVAVPVVAFLCLLSFLLAYFFF